MHVAFTLKCNGQERHGSLGKRDDEDFSRRRTPLSSSSHPHAARRAPQNQRRHTTTTTATAAYSGGTVCPGQKKRGSEKKREETKRRRRHPSPPRTRKKTHSLTRFPCRGCAERRQPRATRSGTGRGVTTARSYPRLSLPPPPEEVIGGRHDRRARVHRVSTSSAKLLGSARKHRSRSDADMSLVSSHTSSTYA